MHRETEAGRERDLWWSPKMSAAEQRTEPPESGPMPVLRSHLVRVYPTSDWKRPSWSHLETCETLLIVCVCVLVLGT